jgi:hypothetical protein
MQSEESQIDPAGALVPNEPAKGDRLAEKKVSPPGAVRRPPLWLQTLAAGLVAGALSWLGGELTQDALFPITLEMPPEVAKMERGREKSAIVDRLLTESKRAAERNKTAAAYGLLGALLGVALGLVGGRSGGSAHSGWRGAAGGGLTAAVAGAALSWGLIPFMYRLQAAAKIADPDFASRFLQIHCLFHAGFAAGVGFAAGLALGWGLGDRTSLGRALIGGLFGALAGVFLFEMINTTAYPSMRGETPLPEESLARLAMYLCVAGGAALLAGLAADARPRRSRSTSLAS